MTKLQGCRSVWPSTENRNACIFTDGGIQLWIHVQHMASHVLTAQQSTLPCFRAVSSPTLTHITSAVSVPVSLSYKRASHFSKRKHMVHASCANSCIYMQPTALAALFTETLVSLAEPRGFRGAP
nr:uncharacterized protein LOC119178681 [Rhipicephalus microplus]